VNLLERVSNRPSLLKKKTKYDKSTHSVTVSDLVILQEQPKLDRIYQGPYQIYDTDARVKPITEPDSDLRTISLQKVSNCRSEIKGG